MTELDILKLEEGYSETKIQHTCVSWFRLTFPQWATLMFAISNGGYRDKRGAAMMKYAGQLAGVADVILESPEGYVGNLHIEMKVPKVKGSRSAGRQSEAQKVFEKAVTDNGHHYVVCHGLCEFVQSVCTYLKLDPQPHIENVLRQYPRYL